MPYHIVEGHSECPDDKPWAVVKDSDGEVMGCHESREKAEDQIAAIEANEEESNATRNGGDRMTTVKEAAIASAEQIAALRHRALSGSTSTVTNMTVTDGWNFTEFQWNGTNAISPLTWTWNITAAADGDEDQRTRWEGILALEGHPTSDKRYLMPGQISHRELPIPLLAQSATAMGHEGAEICGRIEAITHIPIDQFEQRDEYNLNDVRDETVVIWAEGTFDTSEHGQEACRLIENGAGVSVDLTVSEIFILDEETYEEVPEDEIDFEKLFFGEYVIGFAAKIAGTTIVAIPAFEEAEITDDVEEEEEAEAIAASAATDDGRHVSLMSSYGLSVGQRLATALTAAAAGEAPIKPPLDWFSMPEPNTPTPLTVTADGRVFGHLALWNQCHTGFAFCERPPKSMSGYAHFHVGQIETAEGELINVGRVTVGEAGRAKGGHASIVLGRQGAMDHYDKTGCVGAFVRATNGRLGIWLSGAVRSDVPAERIRDMRANPPSGDWRDGELVAVLSVPVPGFPIPRAEARLVASGANEQVPVLIATGYSPDSDEAVESEQVIDLVSYRKRMKSLRAQATIALAVARGDALPITDRDTGEIMGYQFTAPSEELSQAAADALTSGDCGCDGDCDCEGDCTCGKSNSYITDEPVEITLEPVEKKRVLRRAKA